MFQIVVDSAANIPAELVKKYQIQVLSFVNYVDGKELVCFDPSLSPEEEREKGKKYYDAMRAGMDVKTGLISTEILRTASAALWSKMKMCFIFPSAKISVVPLIPQDLQPRL